MPIHEKDKIRGELLDDVYASSDLSIVMPKYTFPQKEHAAQAGGPGDYAYSGSSRIQPRSC